MKKAFPVLQLTVSLMAGMFVLSILALVAVNPGYFTGGRFMSYDAASGVLTFLGESFVLPEKYIEAAVSYPGEAFDFVLSFLPDWIKWRTLEAAGAVKSFLVELIRELSHNFIL